MTRPGPRESVAEFCRLAWQRGYMAATDGNISLRLESGDILITPAGRSKAFVKAGDLIKLDAGGRLLAGPGKPSAEAEMHLACYRGRPDVNAVIHAHPPHAVALTLAGRGIEAGAIPEVLVSLGQVPTVEYATPGSKELALLVGPAAAGHDAMLLAGHGTLAMGPDLETAWARTEKLESAAKTLMLAEALGGARQLPLDEQKRLLEMGGRKAEAADPPPLAQRVEYVELPVTSEFLVEKRFEDQRGQAHLIVDNKPIRRVCLLSLEPGAGYRGSHVHLKKFEGFYVSQGRARVEMACRSTGERLEMELGPGGRLWIPPGVAHRIEALESLAFVEFTDRPYDAADDMPFEF